MNRLYEVPRAFAISELVSKYPNEIMSRARKLRRKISKRQNSFVHSVIKDPLFLLVTVVRAHLTEERDIPNLYVNVCLNEEEQKTRVVKSCEEMQPEWNETIVFNVLAIKPASNSIVIQLREMQKHTHITIGYCKVPFVEICSDLEQEKVLQLDQEDPHTQNQFKPKSTLIVKFTLKGPAAALCPNCHLYLGSSSIIVYKETKYHLDCVHCTSCSKPIVEDLKVVAQKFFCKQCYTKKHEPAENGENSIDYTSVSGPQIIRHHSPSRALEERTDSKQALLKKLRQSSLKVIGTQIKRTSKKL